ncbi:outer membrane lipoprotein carrier protein LolA [Bacteroidota bacterium]
MKKLLVMITLFIFIGNISAQQSEKNASEILKKVTEKTKTYSSIKIEFIYTIENKEANLKESKKGTLLIKGDKYNLNLVGQTVISNALTIWTYIPDANEVQINSIEEDDESLTPTKLLTSYYKEYKSKLIKETSSGGKIVQIIDCVPLQGKSYYKVRLTIDKTNLQIVKIAIHDKNGSIYSYAIKSFVSNLNISDTKFKFNKSDFPVDVDVVDMR